MKFSISCIIALAMLMSASRASPLPATHTMSALNVVGSEFHAYSPYFSPVFQHTPSTTALTTSLSPDIKQTQHNHQEGTGVQIDPAIATAFGNKATNTQINVV